jgi:hypothetical protein
MPRREVAYRDTVLQEMDVPAILARRPDVVLVDEFAHTNAPGSPNEKRWQDVEALLVAGIDVVSTLNIQHLESLNDVISKITGTVQRETVPDEIVRRADQIELVDMAPEAIRRRMAHGNIYPAERVDAALANYFRPGNLGALRELALLWVADRVEESLTGYLDAHGISEAWETRERVVVGLTGFPSGEAAIRRAARMAGRVGGELIGVHVAVDDGLAREDSTSLAAPGDLGGLGKLFSSGFIHCLFPCSSALWMRCASCVMRMKSAPRIAPAAVMKRLASSLEIPARLAKRAERSACGALGKSGCARATRRRAASRAATTRRERSPFVQ